MRSNLSLEAFNYDHESHQNVMIGNTLTDSNQIWCSDYKINSLTP
jgi:hypothetical protein